MCESYVTLELARYDSSTTKSRMKSTFEAFEHCACTRNNASALFDTLTYIPTYLRLVKLTTSTYGLLTISKKPSMATASPRLSVCKF